MMQTAPSPTDLAHRAYPLRTPPQRPQASAITWYCAWARLVGVRFRPDRLPWVPLATAGPVLVLGHATPLMAEEPPLPATCFQPVLLQAGTYDRLLANAAELIELEGTEGEWLAPERTPPERWETCTAPEALGRLIECFPMPAEWLPRLRQFAAQYRRYADLPGEIAAAAWLVGGGGGLAPASLGHAPEAIQLPDDLGREVRVVAREGRRWWVAAPKLPASELEDRLLAELPEDAQVEWLWLAEGGSQGNALHTHPQRATSKVTAAGTTTALEGNVTLTLDGEALRRFDARAVRVTGQDLFLWLLYRALEDGASDLHIEPGIGVARARLRVHGSLHEILEMADSVCRAVAGAAKAAVGLPSENFKPLDGAFSVRLGSATWNVRVSAYPIRKEYQKLVFRFLPRRSKSLQFADLLQPESVVRRLAHAIRRPQGLILVCGPTGSGKTTTLMTCLSEINRPELNIVTLEDPVEYEIQGLNQAEVDTPRRVGWADLLSSVLRQDPDVILVGEIRDQQTAEIALRAALTGHLVFATLHTLSSCKAVQRLLDLGVNADMLAESLVLIQSQRLLSRLCPECRDVRPAGPSELAELQTHAAAARALGTFPAVEANAGRAGCPHCKGSGYSGRIAAMELIPVDEACADLISRGTRALELQRHASRAGHPTLFEAALLHAARGEITWAEARSEQGAWEGF